MLTTALATLLPLALPQDLWTRAEMTADLAQLTRAVREKYAYLDDRTENFALDLDAVHAAGVAALEDVASKEDFERVLRTFVAQLQDGHGGVSFATDTLPAHYMLLSVERCSAGLVVSALDEDGALGADARPPQRGDLLRAIDGRPIEEVLRGIEEVSTGSTPGQRRAKALVDLRIARAAEIEVELEDVAGTRHTLRLRTRNFPLMPERRNWDLTWPADGVALLRVESFVVKDWGAWLQADHEDREPFLRATFERMAEIFDELATKEAGALIIDVRGNAGGTDALGIRLAEHLLEGTFGYFLLSALRDGEWSKPANLLHGRAERRVFGGRVVALTDERCFSTTDNFLRCLDDLHPNFTVVGRPTGGGTGAPRTIATLAHSGAHIRLCTMRVYGPKGGLIEGRGTQPDVAVTWTRADVIAGRDPDLIAALEQLQR